LSAGWWINFLYPIANHSPNFKRTLRKFGITGILETMCALSQPQMRKKHPQNNVHFVDNEELGSLLFGQG